MTTMDRVAELALALPDVTEGERRGGRCWRIGDKVFAWERAFSKADLKRYGAESPPSGAILAVCVADLGEKEAALASHDAFFTIPHFDGYPAVLVALEQVPQDALAVALEEAWAVVAPPAVVQRRLQQD